jgi:hypothetical protein
LPSEAFKLAFLARVKIVLAVYTKLFITYCYKGQKVEIKKIFKLFKINVTGMVDGRQFKDA